MLSRGLILGALAFAAAAVVSLLLTPAIRDFAIRRRYVDMVGSVRKIHTRSIPRLGGLAIFAAWLIAAGVMLAMDSSLRDVFWSARPRAVVFVLGGIAAAAVGFVDDVRGLRARYKLAAQFAIGLALCWAGFTVHEVQLPGGMVLSLGPFAVPFTMLWIAAVMNAMNLIDGLDGLAAGVAVIALGTVFVFAVVLGYPLLAVYSAALGGAVIGFLVYNFNPASIFMGDAGALLLGYFLSVALLRPPPQSSTQALELAVPLLVLGVPLCDLAMAICRRVLQGRGVFSPDREHVHHRLLARGLSQRQVALILYGAAGLLAAAALASAFGDSLVDLSVCGIIAVAVTYAIYRIKQPSPFDGLRAVRRRNQELRSAVAQMVGRLESATRMSHVFETMEHLPSAFSAAAIRTQIGELVFEYARPHHRSEGLKLQFSLGEGRHRFGHVEIAWDDGRAQLDAVHALAIEEVCDNVVRALRRVSPQAATVEVPAPALAMDRVQGRFTG